MDRYPEGRLHPHGRLCKKLGLKFNFAMLLLPDEMYKSQHGSYEVIIGEPISWEKFDRSKSPAQWAEYVQNEVYKLK